MNKVTDGYKGDVIKINGVCYEFLGFTEQPVDSVEDGPVYATCEECESTSSLPGEQDDSSAIAGFEASSVILDEAVSSAVDATQDCPCPACDGSFVFKDVRVTYTPCTGCDGTGLGGTETFSVGNDGSCTTFFESGSTSKYPNWLMQFGCLGDGTWEFKFTYDSPNNLCGTDPVNIGKLACNATGPEGTVVVQFYRAVSDQGADAPESPCGFATVEFL